MRRDEAPKVVLNDEYLDLRNPTPKNNSLGDRKSAQARSRSSNRRNAHQPKIAKRVVNLNNEGLRYEKELINCGLKKLATSYNSTANVFYKQNNTVNTKKKIKPRELATNDHRYRKVVVLPQDKPQLKSHSEYSFYGRNTDIRIPYVSANSTPIIQAKKTFESKVEPVVNKYIMAKPEDVVESNVVKPESKSRSASKARSKSREYKKDVDPRLSAKYSVLKFPSHKSWTLPSFAVKTSLENRRFLVDYSDRQTYLYDEGTEIDSVYLDEQQIITSTKSLRKHCMLLLFCSGSVCGILLVSLLIWLIFGNDIFASLLVKPQSLKAESFTQYFKYWETAIIYVIMKVFDGLAYVLAMPTEAVYEAEKDYYKWPINPAQWNT